MILEWGKEPEYHSWPNQPMYRVFQLSDVLKHTEVMLKPNMHVRVNLDIDISYEEATFIKDTFIKDYNLREMALTPVKSTSVDIDLAPGEVHFESVDQIVSSQLVNIESDTYNKNTLLAIYNSL